MRRTARPGLLLALILAAACRGPEERSAFRGGDLVLPCEQQGYPCTWNDVEPGIVTRTRQLADIAARYALTAPSLDSIAALLAGVPTMAEVLIDGAGVRFRLQGGRPAWVFLPGELDHHRIPAGALPPARPDSGPSTTGQGATDRRSPMVRFARRLGPLVTPSPLHAAQPQRGQRVAGEEGEGKKALILSPFDFEWPEKANWKSLGADFARRTRVIRDYDKREIEGAEVIYHGDISQLSDNPASPPREQRTLGGESLLSSEVVFQDFLGWDKRKLNLIILATHGTAVSCFREAPRGGAAARPTKEQNLPEVADLLLCPLIYAGRAKQESYGNYHGVEIYATALHEWNRSADPVTRYDSPGETGWRDLRPELSQADASHCAAQVAAGTTRPTTPSGAECGDRKWEHDYSYLVLWWPFFRDQYPQGLNNSVVFLGACHSGINMVLPDILAPDGNEAVTVFGFETTVNAGDAWQVISTMLDLIDDGYHSKELLAQLKALDRTNHLVGRTMDPLHQVAPAEPAEILEKRTHPTHARDVVQLIDPETGVELAHGDMVTVLGAPDDGMPDSLRLRARIIGVAGDDPIEEVRLFVSPGNEGDSRAYRPERRVEKGVFEFDGDLQLGRDHRKGEVLDLEIRAELPDGGTSRWVYRDIRLGGSWWAMDMSGARTGRFGGARATAVARGRGIVGITLMSDAAPINQVVITFDPKNPLTAPATFTPAGGVAVALDLDQMANGGADGFCTGRGGAAYPPPPSVAIRSVTERYVTGFVTGMLHRCDPGHKPNERSSVQIDFVAAVCVRGTAGARSCRR